MSKDGSMRRWRLWLPLVVSCLLTTSCSLARLGYDFFPTWAMWQIDGYLSLDGDQRLIANRRLNELHDWHRRGQLPEYVAFIRSLKQRAPTRITEDEAAQIRQKTLAAWLPVAEKMAPGMAELLLTVQPSQVLQMRQEFIKANRKQRAEYLPSDRLAARADRTRKRFAYFLGDLSDEQERQLRQMSDAMPANEEIWLAEREARQQRFLILVEQLIKERPAVAVAEQLARDYLVSMWSSQDPQRRQRLDEASRASDRMTAKMLAQVSPDQHSQLSSRLLDWEQTFSHMTRP